MDEKPKRRWFQIRLSTMLILTAIVAWGMATPIYLPIGLIETPIGAPRPRGADRVVMDTICLGSPRTSHWLRRNGYLKPDIVWPAVAFVSFVAWKVVWAVVVRRRIAA